MIIIIYLIVGDVEKAEKKYEEAKKQLDETNAMLEDLG